MYNIIYNREKDYYNIEYHDDEGFYHYIEAFPTEESAKNWVEYNIETSDWR